MVILIGVKCNLNEFYQHILIIEYGFIMTFSYMYISYFDHIHPTHYPYLSDLSLFLILFPNSPSSSFLLLCFFYFVDFTCERKHGIRFCVQFLTSRLVCISIPENSCNMLYTPCLCQTSLRENKINCGNNHNV
jgi:hypothetical protein